MNDVSDLEEKFYEIYWMPEGEHKISLWEELLREADRIGADEEAMQWRLDFVPIAYEGGQINKSIHAFTHALAQFRQDPDRYASLLHNILWYFKFVVHVVHGLPRISLEQIDSMIQQMTELHRANGYSIRSLLHYRVAQSMSIGERESVTQFYQAWQNEPVDDLVCEACEDTLQIEYFNFLDQPKNAIRAAAKILAGDRVCSSTPHYAYGHLLRPLVKTEQMEKAKELHKVGYKMICKERARLGAVGDHLEFVLEHGTAKKAAKLLERHLPWATDTENLALQFTFFRVAHMVCRHFANSQSKREFTVPADLAPNAKPEVIDPTQLSQLLTTRLTDLAQQFDTRHGNNHFASQLDNY